MQNCLSFREKLAGTSKDRQSSARNAKYAYFRKSRRSYPACTACITHYLRAFYQTRHNIVSLIRFPQGNGAYIIGLSIGD